MPRKAGFKAPEGHALGTYPTDERIRQKEKLKAGHVPTARKQIVEDHHDDCGTDLSGIIPYLLQLPDLGDYDFDFDDSDDFMDVFPIWWFSGMVHQPSPGAQTTTFTSFVDFLTYLTSIGYDSVYGVDVVEVCGG